MPKDDFARALRYLERFGKTLERRRGFRCLLLATRCSAHSLLLFEKENKKSLRKPRIGVFFEDHTNVGYNPPVPERSRVTKNTQNDLARGMLLEAARNLGFK